MNIGDTAPDFVLKDQSGNEFKLSNQLDKNILLVFYPKDSSPVCSVQLRNYNESVSEFEKKNIKVIGINSGNETSHKNFCDELELKFPLLADSNKLVCKYYDAVNLFGIVKRKLVLVGNNRKILWIHSALPFSYKNSAGIIKELEKQNLIKMT